ncbi:hypothetical protein WMY93_003166 [Mugilogobius chulae]|uniref:SAP domain-containing protein n=1 Tax=Mugilogobius chulae TaxID=88201 RepID=A0AAW0PXH6_9GOBI
MLKHLPRVHMESAPFCSQPISSETDGKAARFELERRACQSLRKVLQLKLQQRRTREELVNQGIIPPLKSSASFHEQKRSLERARTEDYLKRKIQRRPERAELIRMHILEEVTAQESVLQKKARLADDLNDKISQRPGPMELIHKNILPVHASIKTAFTETELSKTSDELSSGEEDSIDSQDSSLPSDTLTLTLPSSHAQDSTESPLKLTTPLSTCAQRISAEMKKLKYHEYVPPDQKADKEAPKLDSSYAKLLQQQQLFLHLQILNQQQRQQREQSSSQTHAQLQPDLDQSEPSAAQPVAAPLTSDVKAPAEESTKSVGLPPNLDELKVAELKAELKLRGLTVSGTKSDLIERLRAHQTNSTSRDSTRIQTAGGAKEPGAEAAAKTSKTAVNEHLSLGQQLSSSAAQTAAKPNRFILQIKHSGENCSKSVSLTSSENSNHIIEPKLCKTEMPDHEPVPTPQLNISIKEEQLSPIPTSVYVQKCCLVQPSTSAAKTEPPTAMLVDKDLMLRQKDRQIEELKRLLLHNQRLVDMLKIKLEKRRREEQKTDTMLLFRVVPPNKNNKCAKQPFSNDQFAVKVKQEIVDDDNNMETGPQLNPNGHIKQNGRHQQAVHRLFLQQQSKLRSRPQAIQMHNQRKESQQENMCQEKTKSSRQQQRAELDSQQILLKQKIRLKQEKDLSQQRQSTECQQIQIQTNIELKQPKQESSQCAPNRSSITYFLTFEEQLYASIVTDGNGNHFLITLTNQNSESQVDGNLSKHLALQRLQWCQSKLPGHSSAQLPSADNEDRAIMHMGGLTQQSTKAQSAGPQQSRTVLQHHLTERQCDESETSDTTDDSYATLDKICSNLDCLFSPLSPTTSSSDTKDTEPEDFIDIILKTGALSRFKPAPDPALDNLHRSSSSPSPSSPPLLLLSPTAAPCLDLANTAPSAAYKSPRTAESKKTGRLEDFLESTTGKPLLGVEPDGPLTLIDDLHSQMLCTPSILDHPSSPMDTLDTEPDTCSEEQVAVDGMDWLDVTTEENCNKDSSQLATATPPSVFSTDFLDTYDLETAWDSYL